jgi:hypothetical protein
LILLDTSGLFAALVETEVDHQRVHEVLQHEQAPFLLSPFVLYEIDYLLRTATTVDAELAFLREVANRAYTLPAFGPAEIADAVDVIERYGDLGIGIADASLVVLAGRHGTNRLLTLDERNFRVLPTPAGEPFVLLPADA